MCFIHALVDRKSRILAENRSGKRDLSTAESNDVRLGVWSISRVDDIIQDPSESFQTHKSPRSVRDVWELYLFHYESEHALTCLVMADDAVRRHKPFAFIADHSQRVSAGVGLLSVASMTGLLVYNYAFKRPE